MPYLMDDFGNPHSADHEFGWRAAKAIDQAAQVISTALGCEQSEIIFTSGATEANNLALKGLTTRKETNITRLIVCAIDHKSVIETANRIRNDGIKVSLTPVSHDALIDLDFLENEVRKGNALVSVGYANSELGVIQPMAEIVEICRRHGALLHTDAAQAIGRVQFNFFESDFDLVSMSGHKIFGPKGIGALIVKHDLRRRLCPLFDGGEQQDGNRSGTIPTFLVAGLSKAIQIAVRQNIGLQSKIAKLRTVLANAIKSADPECVFNGKSSCKIAGNINATLSRVDAQTLLTRTAKEISFSTSSACSSGAVRPSHVLQCIGLSDDQIRRTIRLCVGESTSQREVERASKILSQAIKP